MLPFSVRPTQEFFHRQHWENFNKTGWSAGRFSWMHRHSGQKSRGTHHDHSSTLFRGCRSSHRCSVLYPPVTCHTQGQKSRGTHHNHSSTLSRGCRSSHRCSVLYSPVTCHTQGTKIKRYTPRPQFHPL